MKVWQFRRTAKPPAAAAEEHIAEAEPACSYNGKQINFINCNIARFESRKRVPMDYNPVLPEVQANPYPYYTALRSNNPVAWLETLQCWAISRYDDVDYALRNPQIFSSAKWLGQSIGDLNPAPEVPWMIETDPPDHSRLRKLVSKGFTPRMVSRLEPRIRAIASELLAGAQMDSETDFVREFSGALPVIVIAEMLGVEPERRLDFKRWSDNVVLGTSRPSEETARTRVRSSNAEMRAYFEQAIADRRKAPREDLLTALVQAEEEHQTLSAAEVLAMAMLILLAGNETTMNLLSNTVLALLAHPTELARVRADCGMIPQLIEEMLRYDSPVQIVFRRTTQAVELSGAMIPANAAVFLLIGSANRDERKFGNPDRFDLSRDAGDHLAFGFGTHFCLGAQLARLEAKVGLEELLACPPFTVDNYRIERISSVLLRGIKHMPMRFVHSQR
jgi:cytochrome P450